MNAYQCNFESCMMVGDKQFIPQFDGACEIMDECVFRGLQNIAIIGETVARSSGDHAFEKKCEIVSFYSGVTRDMVSSIRLGPTAHKFASLQFLYETNDVGFRTVRLKGGQLEEIPENEKNQWVMQAEGPDKGMWTKDDLVSKDLKYIEDPNGARVRKSLKDIAISVLIFVARILSPIRLLHNLKAIDLGHHSSRMGHVVMSIWSFVTLVTLIDNAIAFIKEIDVSKMSKRVWDALQAFFDLIALPFDFGAAAGVGDPKAAIIITIIGAGLNVLAAASKLLKEAVYYGT